MHRLLSLAPGARRLLAGAVAAGVVGAVALVVQAASLAAIVAGAAFGDGAPTAAFVVLGAAFAVRAATSAATEWLGRAAASQALAALRRRVGEHVLAARAPRVEDARRGELATAAVHGVDALGEYYAKAVPQLALAAVVPPAFVAVVLWHDPVVGILLALTIPLVIVFMVLVGRESAERIAERRVALGVLGTHFLDVVRGLPTLRAHGRAEAQAETLEQIGERYRLESVAALRVAFLSALVLELLAMVGTAIAAAVVGVQLAGGRADVRDRPVRAAARARGLRPAAARGPALPRRRGRRRRGHVPARAARPREAPPHAASPAAIRRASRSSCTA